MKTKVLYFSKGGSTKKVADAIANVVNEMSEQVPPAYQLENVQLLFLGSGVYMGKPHKKVVEFIETLSKERVKNIALFSTCGGHNDAIAVMKDLLKKKGINVLDETFMCPGKFLFINRKHPSEAELQQAQEFARKAISKVSTK